MLNPQAAANHPLLQSPLAFPYNPRDKAQGQVPPQAVRPEVLSQDTPLGNPQASSPDPQAGLPPNLRPQTPPPLDREPGSEAGLAACLPECPQWAPDGIVDIQNP